MNISNSLKASDESSLDEVFRLFSWSFSEADRYELNLQRLVQLRLSWPHHILVAKERRPENPQLLHFVDERSALQAKSGGGTLWSADHPTDSFKRLQNQRPLCVPQSSCRGRGRGPDTL